MTTNKTETASSEIHSEVMISEPRAALPLIGKKVIVRALSAGVHYGEFLSLDGETVLLKNSRRLWYWVVKDMKGISLSDVACHGVSSQSKICAIVPMHIVFGVAEIMETSKGSQKSIEAAHVYHP